MTCRVGYNNAVNKLQLNGKRSARGVYEVRNYVWL